VPAARLATLRADGRANHGDAYAHESRALGVETVLETSDGKLVLLRRSEGVAMFRGVFNGPSGHPEPADAGVKADLTNLDGIEPAAVRREMFDAVVKECVEETGIPAAALSRPRLIGAMIDSFGKPDLLFHTRTSLTAEQVGTCLTNASEAWESSAADVVDATPPEDVESRAGADVRKGSGEEEQFRCLRPGEPAPFAHGASVLRNPPTRTDRASGASAMTRAFWARDPRFISPVTRAAVDCVYMLESLRAERGTAGGVREERVMDNALDAAMDHELFDVARAIERRMLMSAGFA